MERVNAVRITVVAPGASERTEGRLLKLVESALGVPARIVDRAPLTGSAEPALLLDRDTTAAEVKAMSVNLPKPRTVGPFTFPHK